MKITLVIVFILLVLVLATCLWCAIQLSGMISKDEEK